MFATLTPLLLVLLSIVGTFSVRAESHSTNSAAAALENSISGKAEPISDSGDNDQKEYAIDKDVETAEDKDGSVVDKRNRQYIRFGRSGQFDMNSKRNQNRQYIRFGKRANQNRQYIRFGKRTNQNRQYIRFGKRHQQDAWENDEDLRLQDGIQKRKNQYIRFG